MLHSNWPYYLAQGTSTSTHNYEAQGTAAIYLFYPGMWCCCWAYDLCPKKKQIASDYEKKAMLLLQKGQQGTMDAAEADRLASPPYHLPSAQWAHAREVAKRSPFKDISVRAKWTYVLELSNTFIHNLEKKTLLSVSTRMSIGKSIIWFLIFVWIKTIPKLFS